MMLLMAFQEARKSFPSTPQKTVTTKDIDTTIQEILDLVTQDFILSWYQAVGGNPDQFGNLFQ